MTQVVSADRGYVFHNRLTHSLKVAQLARRISEKLRGTHKNEADALHAPDPDIAEAAALAHDLGHPPFGHIAENELDRLARNAGLEDGFEGNAQSFRIVSKLAVGDAVTADSDKTPVIRGLNLTRATLNAILKYPWGHGDNPDKKNKWGVYDTERNLYNWVRQINSLHSFAKIPEAAIMDWADDITYAVHDLVDFYCAGQIPTFSNTGEIKTEISGTPIKFNRLVTFDVGTNGGFPTINNIQGVAVHKLFWFNIKQIQLRQDQGKRILHVETSGGARDFPLL